MSETIKCPKCGSPGEVARRCKHFDCGAWIDPSGEYHDYEGGCLIERQKQEIHALKSRLGRMSETTNYILDRLLQTAPQDVFEDCQERWDKATGDQ